MFRSIRWRIATASAVLIIVCVASLSVYLAHFFRERYVANLRIQLTDQALMTADSSAPYFVGGAAGEVDNLCKRLGLQIRGRITVIDGSGVVLGDSEQNPVGMENHANRPEVLVALSNGSGSSIRYSSTLGYDMMYVAVPVALDGKTVGVARVSLALSELDEFSQHTNTTVVSASLVAGMVAILMSLQISKVTTEQIGKLTRMSGRMAEGQLDQEIKVTSRDEVGRLATAFNLMAARLKETMSSITTERDRMAVVLSNMGDGMVVVDGAGRVTMVNKVAEKILQISESRVPGKTFIEVTLDYELNEILQRCLETRQQQTGMVEVRRNRQFLGVIATPLQVEIGCMVLLQDLTEMRRLETVRRDFVSNISHELRTPIASLKALAETLQEGAIEDSLVAKDFLSKINAETDRLAQMVQELGELSRIESGEALLRKRPLDVTKIIDHAVNRLKAQADRVGLKLVIDLPSSLPLALADSERLEQVLINVIHNAIKFTPPGGQISLSAREDGDNIHVSVADTGVGISADDLPRIFERFYKADKARAGGGTGLGLAIAKHIIESHGGRIWAESVEGKGSVIHFTLPSVPIN
ncbi:MAG: ATP-binding protein [Chloroflexota bacterium]